MFESAGEPSKIFASRRCSKVRLGLVIPLYDEEDLVTEVVASIHATLKQAGIEHVLVLVNNGSQDQTAALVDDLSLDASVVAIHLRENAGYGGGILAGLAWLGRMGYFDFIDCQVESGHLSSLGAKAIDRPAFERLLADAITEDMDRVYQIIEYGLASSRRDPAWCQALPATARDLALEVNP